MAVYLVTWDLNKEGLAYSRASANLQEALNKYADTKKDSDLDSVRFISTPAPAAQKIKTHLMKSMDDNDTLVVVRMNKGEYATHVYGDVKKWLDTRAT